MAASIDEFRALTRQRIFRKSRMKAQGYFERAPGRKVIVVNGQGKYEVTGYFDEQGPVTPSSAQCRELGNKEAELIAIPFSEITLE